MIKYILIATMSAYASQVGGPMGIGGLGFTVHGSKIECEEAKTHVVEMVRKTRRVSMHELEIECKPLMTTQPGYSEKNGEIPL